MLIYRMENIRGCNGHSAFYHSDALTHGIDLSYYNMDEYPSPENDKGIRRDPCHDEYCACCSLEQLHYWFTAEDAEILANKKVFPYMIEVSECVVGDKQVLFKKEDMLGRRVRINYATGEVVKEKKPKVPIGLTLCIG